MSTPDWQRLWRLFDAAAERPRDQRATYLKQECGGDPALHRLLRSLLGRHDAADGVLDGPAPSSPDLGENWVGRDIGPYRVLRLVGEGGVGVVYEARQRAPFERRVALKLLRRGLATRDVLDRFASEGRHLARLHHPSIAGILDVGVTDDGRSYLVIDYVDGVPITEYCDRERLDLRSRILLFLDVCHGVQHAHGKALIHRDLKPSNVLVTQSGGRPTPRIIDFGLSKRLMDDDRSCRTRTGMVVGTPFYMSPERVADEGVVNTRADVYSLGVLLYELLTGMLPFPFENSFFMTPEHIRSMVLDKRAILASRRIREADSATLLRASAARRVRPGRLARCLRGDLDSILERALAKAPDRRYGSPADLADDLRRHLDGAPVAARSRGPIGAAWKLCVRHRSTVLSLAAGLLLLVLLSAATVVQARRLIIERDRAVRENRATREVGDLLVRLFDRIDPAIVRSESSVIPKLIRRQADTSRRLDDPLQRARSMRMLGLLYLGLGMVAEAAPLLEGAHEIQLHTAVVDPAELESSMLDLAELRARQGDREAARTLGDEAIAARARRLGDAHPDLAPALVRSADVLRQIGDAESALGRLRRAAPILERSRGRNDPATRSVLEELRRTDTPMPDRAREPVAAL